VQRGGTTEKAKVKEKAVRNKGGLTWAATWKSRKGKSRVGGGKLKSKSFSMWPQDLRGAKGGSGIELMPEKGSPFPQKKVDDGGRWVGGEGGFQNKSNMGARFGTYGRTNVAVYREEATS